MRDRRSTLEKFKVKFSEESDKGESAPLALIGPAENLLGMEPTNDGATPNDEGQSRHHRKQPQMITTTIETITPETATLYLQSNPKNRALNSRAVATIAQDIATDRFILNGESIKFDQENNLLDGQHRLHGCVKANTPIETLVVRGLPRFSRQTVDVGTKRTLADIIRMDFGLKDSTGVAAATKATYMFQQSGGLFVNALATGESRVMRAPTTTELLAWLGTHMDTLIETAANYKKIKASPVSVVAPIMVPIFAAVHTGATEELNHFVDVMKVGADAGDPINALRNLSLIHI